MLGDKSASLADLGLFVLAGTYHHAALWLAALCFAVVPVGLGTMLGTMLDTEKARCEGEWRAANYRTVTRIRKLETQYPDGRVVVEDAKGPFNRERFREWIDANGNGRVDPGEVAERPRTTYITGAAPVPVATAGTRARALCQWCYRRAAQGLRYGQRDRGTEWSRAEYDTGMEILTKVGLIAGGKQQGVERELVVVPLPGQDWGKSERAALAIFDTLVKDE